MINDQSGQAKLDYYVEDHIKLPGLTSVTGKDRTIEFSAVSNEDEIEEKTESVKLTSVSHEDVKRVLALARKVGRPKTGVSNDDSCRLERLAESVGPETLIGQHISVSGHGTGHVEKFNAKSEEHVVRFGTIVRPLLLRPRPSSLASMVNSKRRGVRFVLAAQTQSKETKSRPLSELEVLGLMPTPTTRFGKFVIPVQAGAAAFGDAASATLRAYLAEDADSAVKRRAAEDAAHMTELAMAGDINLENDSHEIRLQKLCQMVLSLPENVPLPPSTA